MDNQRSGVGDGLEEPLSQARQNTFGIIKALRENAGLDLRVTSKTGEEGHLKLGPGNTLQAEIGKNSVAVTEHPGQFSLTEAGIVAYREHVRQRAEKAAKDPYTPPSRPAAPKRVAAKDKESERDHAAVEAARHQLMGELERIFDTTRCISIHRGITFSLLSGFNPALITSLRNAKFSKTNAGPHTIYASGSDVVKFLDPLCKQRRFRDSLGTGSGQFYTNTIEINSRDHTVTIRETGS